MQKGFGLIGILVVVAVIAIAGVGIFKTGVWERNPFGGNSQDEKVLQIVDAYITTLNQQCESDGMYQSVNEFGNYEDEIGAINPERYDSHANGIIEDNGKSFTIIYPLIEKNDNAKGWSYDYTGGFGSTHIAYIHELGVHCVDKKQYTDNCTMTLVDDIQMYEPGDPNDLTDEGQYRYAIKKLGCPDSFLNSFEFKDGEINYHSVE
ncbi:MAG: type II secretion system protein [Patescibacteria group bacterium]